MSTSVDKRIVEMEFDSEKFKSGAKDTMKVLQDLDNNLNADRSGISKSLDFIADKFTVLGTMGRRAIENITDSLMGMGKSLVNDFVIEPKTQGFEEYELKMGSIQTIVNSVIKDFNSEAEAVEYVGEKLDALNEYADKTKYSFAEATASIGKFTNAGVDLDESINAIQGIMNLAAISGQGSQQANMAMFNFAQALGTGYLGLLDWRSIENANLHTIEFKNELIKTAEAMGTLVKEGDQWVSTTTNASGQVSDAFDAAKGFRDSLQHQWLTSEVLTKTLERYADETTDIGKRATEAAIRMYKFTETMDALKETVGSGWAKTWELIFGDFTEATNLWTAVYKSFNQVLEDQGNNRNALLQTWRKEYGGAQQMQTAVQNILDGIKGFLNQIKEAWRSVFPPKTAEDLQKFGESIVGMTERFKKAGTEGEFLKNVVTVLARIIKVFTSAFKIAAAVIKGIIKVLQPIGKLLGVIFDRINDFLGGIFSSFKDGTKSVDLVTRITNGIAIAFDFLAEHLGKAVDWIINSMGLANDTFATTTGMGIGSKIKSFFSGIKDAISKGFADMRGFSGITETLSGIWTSIKEGFSGGFTGLIEGVKNLATSMKEHNFGTLLDAVNLGAIIALSLKIRSAIGDFKDMIKSFKDIAESLQDVLKNVSKVLGSASKMLKAKANELNATAFMKVSIGITILAAALAGLTFVDQDALAGVVALMGILALAVMGILAVMNKSTGTGAWFDQLANGFNTLSKSLSMTAIGVGLTGIMVSLVALAGVILLYDKMGWGTFISGFIKIAVAFGVLGVAISRFASVTAGCAPSIIALGAAFLTISASMVVLAGAIGLFTIVTKNGGWSGFGMFAATFATMAVIIGAGLLALSKFSDTKIKAITTGILKLSVSLMAMAVAVNLLVPALAVFTLLASHGGWNGFFLLAATMGIVSVAMLALAAAVRIMGKSGRYLSKIAVGIGVLALSFVGIALLAPMIIANADKIKDALFILVDTVCDVLIKAAPKIILAIFTLLDLILSQLNSNLPALVTKILNILTGILTGLADYTPAITQQLYRIVKGVISTLFDLMKADVPDSGTLYGIIAGIVGLNILIRSMAKTKEYIKDATKTLGFMGLLILGVVAVFWALNKLGVGDDVTVSQAIAVGLVMTALAISMEAMSKSGTGGKGIGTNLANMLIFVGGAFAIMQMFRTIQDLNGWKMIPQAIAIGLVIAALGFAMGQLKSVGDFGQGLGILVSAVPFVVMMLFVAKVFKDMEGLDAVRMIEQAVAIGLIMVAMGYAASLANKYESSISSAGGIAIQLAVFALSMLAAAGAFIMLKNSGFSDSQNMIAMAISMGLVIVAMGYAAQLASKNETNFQSGAGVAVTLVGLAVGLVAIGFALSLLKDCDPVSVIADALALSLVLLVMVDCAKTLSKISDTKFKDAMQKAGYLLDVFIALIGAGGAVIALSHFVKEGTDPLLLLTSALAVDMIMVAMVDCAKTLSKIPDTEFRDAIQKAGYLVDMLIPLLGSTGVVIALSHFVKEGTDPTLLLAATGALILIMDDLIAMTIAFNKLTDAPKDIGDKALLLCDMLIPLLGSTGALLLLANFAPGEDIEGKADALVKVLDHLIAMTVIFNTFTGEVSDLDKKITLLGVMCLALFAADGALILLSNFGKDNDINGDEMVKNANAIKKVVDAMCEMAITVGGLSLLKVNPIQAGKMGLVIDGISVILAAGVSLLGQIDEWTSGDFGAAIEGGGEILVNTLSSIGAAVGGLLGGIAGGLVGEYQKWESKGEAAKIENIGNAMSKFADQVAPALDKFKNTPQSIKSDMERITNVIIDFAKKMTDNASVWAAITNQFTFPVATLLDIVKSFVELTEIADKGKTDAVSGLVNSITSLGTSVLGSEQAISNLSRLTSKTGNYDTAFGALGAGIKDFYNQTKDLDSSVVQNAKDATKIITILTDTFKTIVNLQGGLTAIKNVANGLPELGKGIRGYCLAVKGLKSEDCEEGIKITQSILDFYKNIVKIDAQNNSPISNIWESLTATNSLSFENISTSIIELGLALKSFAENTKDLGSANVTTGVNNVAQAINQLKSINQLKTENIDTFTKAFEDLAKAGVSGFITALVESRDKIRNAIHDMCKDAESALMEHTTATKSAGEKGGKDVVNDFVNGVKDGSTDFSDLIKSYGKDSGTNYLDGFMESVDRDKIQSILKEDGLDIDIDSMLNTDLVDLLKDNNIDLSKYGIDVGKNFGDGFADGIYSKYSTVTEASSYLGGSALDKVSKVIDAHSPSKKTYELGKFFDEGFGNGIHDFSKNVYTQVKSMAYESLNIISAVFDDIENREWRPSITPVIDLNDVQNGMQWMNSSFNGMSMAASFGLDKANGIAISMDSAMDNSKLAGEVSKLGEEINGLQTTLANGDLNNGVQAMATEMTGLRGDIDSMMDSMSNLKVVMNGNALVGQIINQVDSMLGKKARLAARK